MKNKDLGIQKIKYGEIHFYYPIKFNSKISYTQICESIKKSPLLFTDEYQQKVMDSFGYSFAKIFENIKDELESTNSLDNTCILKMHDYKKYRNMNTHPMEIQPDRILLEFESGESSIKIHFKDADLELLNRRLIRSKEEYELSLKFYGKSYANRQDRFLLLPIQLELESGESTWLYPFLYVFENNMGILKLELPLVNSNTYPLFSNDLDKLIKKIINKWNIKDFIPTCTFFSIKNSYLDKLYTDTQLEFISYPTDIKNIILVDFDGIPQNLNSIPDSIQEDLYRIVCAPVPSRENTSYKKDAIEYIKNHSWGGHGIKYIIKSTGGCLSFVDHSILNYVCEDYKTQEQSTVLTPFDDYYIMCNNLAKSLCLNVEFALLVSLLKKTNESNDYFNKITSSKKLSETQIEYHKNILFISELQEDCYGSVSEQTACVEQMMPHYFKSELTIAKKMAINDILKQKEQENNERFQNYISTGGLILSLIFGLPSLYETLSIIRSLFSFIPYNIPYLTLENTSTILWFILNIIIIKNIFIKKHFDKIKEYCHSIVKSQKNSQEMP